MGQVASTIEQVGSTIQHVYHTYNLSGQLLKRVPEALNQAGLGPAASKVLHVVSPATNTPDWLQDNVVDYISGVDVVAREARAVDCALLGDNECAEYERDMAGANALQDAALVAGGPVAGAAAKGIKGAVKFTFKGAAGEVSKSGAKNASKMAVEEATKAAVKRTERGAAKGALRGVGETAAEDALTLEKGGLTLEKGMLEKTEAGVLKKTEKGVPKKNAAAKDGFGESIRKNMKSELTPQKMVTNVLYGNTLANVVDVLDGPDEPTDEGPVTNDDDGVPAPGPEERRAPQIVEGADWLEPRSVPARVTRREVSYEYPILPAAALLAAAAVVSARA